MLNYPNIDPVIFHIYGVLAVRWYSLAYLAGFVVCFFFFRHYNKRLKIMPDNLCETYATTAMLCLLFGARIFDCIFYNFKETITHPLTIVQVWNGGMSFHGGLIGLVVATIGFCKYYKVNAIRILDLCVVVMPFALFCGRIANFINGELYGNITYTSPLRMIFPTDPTGHPRHPSQLYEAFAEGICLLIIMITFFKKTNFINKTGLLCGCFGIFYSIARFICEFFRRPEIDNFLFLTAGQWLSIFLLFFSIIWMLFWNKTNTALQAC